MANQNFITKSVEETISLGEKIGEKIHGGDVICLTGDLGGGKTHLTKGIAKALGIKETIVSPTFVVMKIYERESKPNLYHLDLYRMNSADDLEGMDLEDIIENENAIVILEWPERALEIIPKNAIWIEFAYIDENSRNIKIKGINLE